jgi:hypothetical protein
MLPLKTIKPHWQFGEKPMIYIPLHLLISIWGTFIKNRAGITKPLSVLTNHMPFQMKGVIQLIKMDSQLEIGFILQIMKQKLSIMGNGLITL